MEKINKKWNRVVITQTKHCLTIVIILVLTTFIIGCAWQEADVCQLFYDSIKLVLLSKPVALSVIGVSSWVRLPSIAGYWGFSCCVV